MIRRFIGLPILLLALPVVAHAQAVRFGVFPVDPVELLKHLLGPDAGFTAMAELSGEGPSDDDNFHVDSAYAMRGDELRTETDLAKLRGLKACDVAQGKLQDMGLDDTVMIRLPGLKLSYIIYPRSQAYIESPLTWRERLKEITDMQRERLGSGTIDGHPCTRYRLHITNSTGDENDVLLWEAADLKNFPVQLVFEIAGDTFRIQFHDVKLETPDLELFQPPAEYDRYTSLGELVRVRHGHQAPME